MSFVRKQRKNNNVKGREKKNKGKSKECKNKICTITVKTKYKMYNRENPCTQSLVL